VARLKLFTLTPEGRIVLTLKHGKHTYSELRRETGLSDRWLTIKLGELVAEGAVEKRGRWYGLVQGPKVSPCELSLYMASRARLVADELGDLSIVRAVILFGSVAQKRAGEYSDLDVIVVVDEPRDWSREEILSLVSRLEQDYHFTIEPLILSEEDFLDNVYSGEGGILYGLAEGCEVLVDKTGNLGEALRGRVEEIRRSHDYLEDEGVWVKVR